VEQAAESSRLIRFDSFEVNLRSGELRRTGERVRLPDQSFQILAMLLQRPGEVVMRQDIQKKLWPNDTVVEFENSINAAVKRLRLALEDSADEPRYVETLARRGYRWMAPVEWVNARGDTPRDAVPAAPSPAAESTVSNLTGKKVSHYRVLEIVGGGGMGVVYKAEDIKLGRRVALKFLPEELSNDAEAKQRLEREARAASALNHPNICTIYEVEEETGQLFIVMELLEGQTLRDLIAEQGSRTPKSLPLEKLLDLGVQIAEGLDTAHQQGIVHRDIKPANIFITTRGQAKILDFGLAKVQGLDAAEVRSSASESQSAEEGGSLVLSRTGTAMGTAGYMSPEQVRGEKLDARTDLFSFGLVLYEMAAGGRAFAGETAAILHEAIVQQAPMPVRELNPEVPPELERMIYRALEKDRNLRYQSAAEMSADLQRLRRDTGSGAIAELPGNRAAVKIPGSHRLRGRKAVLIAGVVLLLAGGVWWRLAHLRSTAANQLTAQDTVVLADFANSTGDAIFDGTLKQGLATSLRQSPFLNILPDRNVRTTLKLMTKPLNTPLTPEVAREVCQRAGSKAYIAGAIAALGSEHVIGLKAVNCLSGKTLAQQQITAESKDRVLDALGNAAAKLRGELGESLATVTQFDVPLPQATTSSLEALRAYSLAYQAHREQGPTAALPHYLRAIQLDPNFAMAYLNTGISYFAMVENERASEYFTKAFQLREHASEREKLEIAAMYYYAVTGELNNAAQAFQKLVEIYPREVAYYSYLGLVYAREGQYEKAVETERRVYPLAGDMLGFIAAMAKFDLALQRLDEVQQLLGDSQKRKMDGGEARTLLYALGFVRGDLRALKEQVEWFQSIGDESGLQLQSDTEAYSGHLDKAREMTARAAEVALRNDDKEGAGLSRAHAAVVEALFGNAPRARQAAADALKIAPRSPGVEIEAALAFARVGDTGRAEFLSQDLGRRFPLDTQMQSVWLPTIAAQSLLSERKPAAAINLLQAAAPMELGYAPSNLSVISCLYTVHVRAEAYLAAGDDSAAASEFQKVLDHKGIVLNCPTGALAHLGLARANALQARAEQGAAADAARTRALTAYQEFFELWKDADRDIPILKHAQAEYASLK
jgi:serine/threonine protein kinase/tetratricopeptide (TPR) repeat protein